MSKGKKEPLVPNGKNPSGDEDQNPYGVSRRTLVRGGVAGLTLFSSSGLRAALTQGQSEDLLVFKVEDLRTSVGELFKLMRTDRAIRQSFFENPSRAITASILPPGAEMPTEQRISQSNRLLFSLLANDGFRQWASDYQATLSEGIASGQLEPSEIDKRTMYEEVAKAFVKFGDKNLIASLAPELPNGVLQDDPHPWSVTHFSTMIETYLIVAIAVLVVLVLTQIDLTPVTSPVPGVTPREFRSIADQLILQAKNLDRSGALKDRASLVQ